LVDEGVPTVFTQAKQKGFLLGQGGQPGAPPLIEAAYPMSKAYGSIDMYNKNASRWFRDHVIKCNLMMTCNELGEPVNEPLISGWMQDYGEYWHWELPLNKTDETYASASVWRNGHSDWPLIYQKITADAIGDNEEILSSVRSGNWESPRHMKAISTGDMAHSWDACHGMQSTLISAMSGGMSGWTMTHSDFGGALGEKKQNTRTNQMLVRWMELAVFSSVILRSHPSIIPDEISQVWDEDIVPYVKALSGLWQSLRNYRAMLFIQAAETGVPPVRHGIIVHPDDPTWFQSSDSTNHNVHENLHVCPYGHQVGLKQFFLGDDMMIAPIWKEYSVLEMRADGLSIKKLTQQVYLPEGEWTYLWGVNEVYEGPQWITQLVTLGKPAVYWRSNSKYSTVFLKAAADYNLKNIGPVNGVKAQLNSRLKKSKGLSTFVDAVKRVTGKQRR